MANMMYNDYYDLVKEDETLALKLAYDWLRDEDAKEDKLYCYWKHKGLYIFNFFNLKRTL